jgi:hypothetical protein
MASRGGVTDDKIKEVRAIMGPTPSDMDIIRALYQSKNDISSAVNILFDPPKYTFKRAVPAKRKASGSNIPAHAPESSKPGVKEPVDSAPSQEEVGRDFLAQISSQLPSPTCPSAVAAENAKDFIQANSQTVNLLDLLVSNSRNEVVRESNKTDVDLGADLALSPTQAPGSSEVGSSPPTLALPVPEYIDLTQAEYDFIADTSLPPLLSKMVYKNHPKHVDSVTTLRYTNSGLHSSQHYNDQSSRVDSQRLYTKPLLELQALWKEDLVLLGQSSVICLSTCKGPKLSPGDYVMFSFPKAASEMADYKRGWGRGKGSQAAAEIVRFSAEKSGEVRFSLTLGGDQSCEPLNLF